MAWSQLAGPGQANDGQAAFNGLVGLVAFLWLVPAGLFQFQRGIRSKAAVMITRDEISAPQGAFGRVRKTIRLDQVEQVSRYRGKGIDSVSIGYHGNWISLSKAFFRNRKEYERCIEIVEARVAAARHP